jgi:amino acid adenylation domain-containing protein/FkbM family methyltransferase
MAQDVLNGFRLSPQQRRVWRLLQTGARLRSRLVLRFTGRCEPPALQAALATVAERYEILRTSFPRLAGMTLPVQVIAEPGEAPVQYELESLSRADHRLTLALSPLCCDGASLAHLAVEVAGLYAQRAGAEEIFQYADAAQWQNDALEGDEAGPGLDYWRGRLRARAVARLPFERAADPGSVFEPEVCETGLPPSLAGRAGALAEKLETSLEAVLLAGWLALLGRLAGAGRLTVCAALDGRSYQELETALGLFSRSLPITESLGEEMPFRDLVRKVHEQLEEAALWQDFFAWDEEPGEPAEDVPPLLLPFGFEMVKWPPPADLGETRITVERLEADLEPFLLRWVGRPTPEGLAAEIRYDRRGLDREQVERIAASFAALLADALENPGKPLGDLEILDASQRRVLTEWNRTGAPFPDTLCLHELFARRVAESPDEVALVAGERTVRYRELDRWADAVAGELVRRGARPGDLVGLLLERSPAAIASLLGILKAGAAFVVFNPAHPAGRIQGLLEDARPRLVLTGRSWLHLLPEAQPVVDVATIDPEAAGAGPGLPPAGPDSLAYVVYTSGSTGRPKGVAIPHRGVVNYLAFLLSTYGIGGSDVLLQLTDLSYDASVRDTFGPLLAGARLVLLAEGEARDPAAILGQLVRHRATAVLSIVPTLLRALVAAAGETAGVCPSVRTVLVSGEVLRAEDCAAARRLFRPDTRVVNQYGPTECTMTSSWHPVPADSRGEVAIGRPIANIRFHLLDRRLRPVPVGVPGELYIGGVGLAHGYHGLPARTAESFIPDPVGEEPGLRLYRTGDQAVREADGTLRFLGRFDQQVKLRGIRVEPGEIEAHLRRHPRVRDAVVTAREAGGGDLRLIAYVVPDDPAAAIPETQRHRLPNGLVVRHLNRYETEFFYQQIFGDQVDVQCGLDLGPGDIIFDVGANIGLFSLFAHLASPGVRVFAFEPIPEIFEALRTNMEVYGVEATLYNCGLSDRSGEAAFAYYPLSACQSGYYPDEAQERRMLEAIIARQGGTPDALALAGGYFAEVLDRRMQRRELTCALKTVSEVMAEAGLDRIDLLKIDVEKSELDVLAGVRAEDWPKIRQVSIEAHDLDGRLERMVGLLRERGYAVTVEQEDALLADTCLFNIYATRGPAPERAASRRFELSLPAASDAPLSAVELREHLRRDLPEALIPSSFVALDRLPLLPSGKVDRAALPDPEEPQAARDLAAGREQTPLESVIATIMSGVLGRDEVGPGDDFFVLGGHSLLGTQLVLRINQALQLDLPLQALFDHSTVEGLARAVAEAQRAGTSAPPLRRTAASGPMPLSFAQRRLWFLHQLAPAETAYNVRLAVRLLGDLDVARFGRVFREIIRRHEALRTTFQAEGDEIVQVVAPAPLFEIPVLDLRALEPEALASEVERVIERETRRPFDLVHGPLLRIVLLRAAPAEHVVVFSIHHIISDHWSLSVMVREMSILYDAFSRGEASPLPELPVQYGDYASWQSGWLRGEALERHLDYWRRQLAGELPVLALPVKPGSPAVPGSRGAQYDFELPAHLSDALRKLSLQEGATLFMTLLAALAVLLRPYAPKDDVVVGTDVANRTHTEIEPLIGFFVNVLVLRASLAGNPTFRELLARVRRVTLDAYAHQDLPFEKLVEELQPERSAGRASLFQVLFVLQNARRDTLQIPGLEVRRIELERRTSNFDLLLVL